MKTLLVMILAGYLWADVAAAESSDPDAGTLRPPTLDELVPETRSETIGGWILDGLLLSGNPWNVCDPRCKPHVA